jgi:hypothetical protein
MRKYIRRVMPMPEILVVLSAPAQLIVERLVHRPRRIGLHASLSEHDLVAATKVGQDICFEIATMLRRRKVSVLELRADRDVQESIEELSSLLRM